MKQSNYNILRLHAPIIIIITHVFDCCTELVLLVWDYMYTETTTHLYTAWVGGPHVHREKRDNECPYMHVCMYRDKEISVEVIPY